jgi:hypothetical protein
MHRINTFLTVVLIFFATTNIFAGGKHITIENNLPEAIEVRCALSLMNPQKPAEPLLFQTLIGMGQQIRTRPIKSLQIKVGNFACKDKIEVKDVMMDEKDNLVSIGPKNQNEIIINNCFVVQLNK